MEKRWSGEGVFDSGTCIYVDLVDWIRTGTWAGIGSDRAGCWGGWAWTCVHVRFVMEKKCHDARTIAGHKRQWSWWTYNITDNQQSSTNTHAPTLAETLLSISSTYCKIYWWPAQVHIVLGQIHGPDILTCTGNP